MDPLLDAIAPPSIAEQRDRQRRRADVRAALRNQLLLSTTTLAEKARVDRILEKLADGNVFSLARVLRQAWPDAQQATIDQEGMRARWVAQLESVARLRATVRVQRAADIDAHLLEALELVRGAHRRHGCRPRGRPETRRTVVAELRRLGLSKHDAHFLVSLVRRDPLSR